MKKKNLKNIIWIVAGLLLVNLIASKVFMRFDLTENKRYTLSEPTKNIIKNIDEPIFVSVFLKGDFPAHFKRLQRETQYMLEEFSAYNSRIRFEFLDPIEETKADPEAIGQEFFEAGMPPQRLNVKSNGKNSQSLIFPWAIALHGEKTVQIPLLNMNPEDTEEDLVNHSVQSLEYAFADAFKKLTTQKSKKIAMLKGNGELDDIQMASFLKTLNTYYHVAPFTLDSVKENPQNTLNHLKEFDLMIAAKPTQAFSEKEKMVMDQFVMNGGKSLWLVDAVAADKDSIFMNSDLTTLAYPKDLNLTDFFFQYGVRILPSLVNDLHADDMILASGQGKQTQFEKHPWFYAPLAVSDSDHPIVHNIEPVRFDFANPMDTLKNNIKKTILLHSSIATKVEGTPRQISLKEIIGKKPNFESYQNGPQPLAVLLEGKFTSVYRNRVQPFDIKDFKEESPENKMVVIADGDVIKNEVEKGRPTDLEYDPKTGKSYGNKAFLLNAVNYMLDDSRLMEIRSKKVNLAFLDPQKIQQEKVKWQLINLVLPLVILILFGAGFTYYRRRKYARR